MKRILGEHLIGPPPIEEDIHHNTDLIVLVMRPTRIAVRIRRPGYLRSYDGQFTLRYSRPTGTPTEYEKILKGWGDYFFYGHAHDSQQSLRRWWLCDLNIFRQSLPLPLARQVNSDGTGFLAFAFSTLPQNFVKATNNHIQQARLL